MSTFWKLFVEQISFKRWKNKTNYQISQKSSTYFHTNREQYLTTYAIKTELKSECVTT